MAMDLPPHIQRWTMEILGRELFAQTRSRRSGSNSTTPTFVDDSGDAQIKMMQAAQHSKTSLLSREPQEKGVISCARYLSSEESLPADDDDTDSFKSFSGEDDDEAGNDNEEEVDYDTEIEISQAAKVSISRHLAWKGELAATVVSVIFSGRPKVVEIPSPTTLSPTNSHSHSRNPSIDEPSVDDADELPIRRTRPTPSQQDYGDDRVESKRLSRDMEMEAKSKRLSKEMATWTGPKVATPTRASASPAGSDRQQRPVSVYAPTTGSSSSAATAAARKADPLRRKSIANADDFFRKKRDASPPPPLPTHNPSAAPVRGHSRIKSLGRGLSMFSKGSVRGADEKRSTPALPASAAPSGLARAATMAVPPSTSGFSPAPFVRPSSKKLIARGADERGPSPLLSGLGSPPPSPEQKRARRGSASSVTSNTTTATRAMTVSGDRVPEMQPAKRDGRIRVRKRTSILGF